MCGSSAWVARQVGGEGRVAVLSNTCRDRWCLPCAKRRARAVASNLHPYVQHWGADARMVTLTLRSRHEELRSLVDRLLSCFAQLRRSKMWKSTIVGGAAFVEITRGARQHRWHVHLHAICFGRFIPQDQLRSLWHGITGDSYIVDVRAIGSSVHDRERAIGYVLKYATKGLDVCKLTDDADLDEAILALKGRRLVIPFGSWHTCKLTDQGEPGEWVFIGSLHSIIIAARDGDVAARDLLDRLGRRSGFDDDDASTQLARPPTQEPDE